MERWEGKVAMVTGASSGMGECITKKLVEAGLKVAALARRVERIQDLEKKIQGKKGSIKAIKCDITKTADIEAAFNSVEKQWGAIHILINCAGISIHSSVTDVDIESFRQMFEVNVIGLTTAAKLASKSMLKNNDYGHIININSSAGHGYFLMPGTGGYCASKNAVTILSEALRNDISTLSTKIRVTSISPGACRTEMTKDFEKFITKDTPILKPDDVADVVLFALSTPPSVNISELTIQATGENVAKMITSTQSAH